MALKMYSLYAFDEGQEGAHLPVVEMVNTSIHSKIQTQRNKAKKERNFEPGSWGPKNGKAIAP